jgi:hypothetical protein
LSFHKGQYIDKLSFSEGQYRIGCWRRGHNHPTLYGSSQRRFEPHFVSLGNRARANDIRV